MLSPDDARSLWPKTIPQGAGLPELRDLVRSGGDDSPCRAGLRSVCWKVFLLFQTTKTLEWTQRLSDSRDAYSSLRDHFLKFIEHPEQLDAADPLADDQASPWHTVRKDEETRLEIQQDVERCMQDEPFFREERTQKLLLNVLFIYCKLNQDIGYRQGMHELLAPIVWVVEKDAVQHANRPADVWDDVLDQQFVEHDAFTLFSLLMQSAKPFYDLGEMERKAGAVGSASSPIVERSKQIHEAYVAQVDPELAAHLTKIEVLPQIFLILLFGREFPFDNLLTLWDTIFADDPSLDLVDLICVSMLLRIRWQILDANYSEALTLLLKYPVPTPPHGPETLVTDAAFLRDNLDVQGGSVLILKYTGKAPKVSRTPSMRNTTPSPFGRSPQPRSPRLPSRPSPAQFRQQQARVEAFFQGAAKGMFERGEKLGINQAVRDAVGEVKKNMQTLQTPRTPPRMSATARRQSLHGRTGSLDHTALAAVEQRHKKLSLALAEALDDLRAVSSGEHASEEYTAAIEKAMGKIQLAKSGLDGEHGEHGDSTRNSHDSESWEALDAVISPVASIENTRPSPPPSPPSLDASPAVPEAGPAARTTLQAPVARPAVPVPTRSSLAQSSFAWMLEDSDDKAGAKRADAKSSRGYLKPAAGRGRPTSSRERAAFLFGEGDEAADPLAPPATLPLSDEDLRLEAIRGRGQSN